MSFPVHLSECTNCIEFWWRLKIPAVGIDNLITDIVSERLDLKRVGHIVNSWNSSLLNSRYSIFFWHCRECEAGRGQFSLEILARRHTRSIEISVDFHLVEAMRYTCRPSKLFDYTSQYFRAANGERRLQFLFDGSEYSIQLIARLSVSTNGNGRQFEKPWTILAIPGVKIAHEKKLKKTLKKSTWGVSMLTDF